MVAPENRGSRRAAFGTERGSRSRGFCSIGETVRRHSPSVAHRRIRVARQGLLASLPSSGSGERAVSVAGGSERMGRGAPEDKSISFQMD